MWTAFLNEMDQEQVKRSRKEELGFEKELFEQKLKYNEELESKSSTNADQNTSHVGNQSGEQGTVVKLPKLTITKFTM